MVLTVTQRDTWYIYEGVRYNVAYAHVLYKIDPFLCLELLMRLQKISLLYSWTSIYYTISVVVALVRQRFTYMCVSKFNDKLSGSVQLRYTEIWVLPPYVAHCSIKGIVSLHYHGPIVSLKTAAYIYSRYAVHAERRPTVLSSQAGSSLIMLTWKNRKAGNLGTQTMW